MNLMPMNNPITIDIGANIEYINKLLADDKAEKKNVRESPEEE